MLVAGIPRPFGADGAALARKGEQLLVWIVNLHAVDVDGLAVVITDEEHVELVAVGRRLTADFLVGLVAFGVDAAAVGADRQLVGDEKLQAAGARPDRLL